MNARPGWSIRSYLYLLVAAIALPLVGIVAYLWTEAVAENRAAATDRLRQAADHVAAELGRFQRQHEWMMSQVAAAPRIRTLAGCEEETRALRQLHPEVINALVWDTAGNLVCGAGDLPGAAGATHHPALLASAMAGPGLRVSDVFRGLRGDRHLIRLMHPVTDARGNRVGLLTLGLNLDHFDSLLAGLGLPAGAAAGILDGAGHFLARIPDSGRWRGKPAAGPLVAQLAGTANRAAFELPGVDRMHRLYVGFQVPNTAWSVFVGVPGEQLLARHRQWLATSTALVLAILAVSALIAYAVSLRINRPLEALAGAAERVARGDLQASAPEGGFAEAAHVARQFNRMAAELQRNHERLRESAARLDGIIDSAMDSIITMDHEGTVLDFNPAAERTFGHSRAFAVGRKVEDLIVPPHLRDRHREGLARHLATGEARLLGRRIETEGMRADGTLFPVELTVTRIGEHAPPVFTGFIRDITGRKRAEEALRLHADQMRSLSARLIEVEETERRKINRELHDRVGQSLSILNLTLGRLGAGAAPPENWRKVIEDAQALVTATLALVRNVMADLRPAALDDFGLLAALRNHAGLVEAGGLDVAIRGEDLDPRPPLATETALFRIAQEALNNAVKHARATRAAVDLRQAGARIVLTLEDDGVGFDSAAAHPERASWGLATMRERADAIGATLRIDSAPGRGTRVTVELGNEAAA